LDVVPSRHCDCEFEEKVSITMDHRLFGPKYSPFLFLGRICQVSVNY
jgi:hypothetical protein